jgi:IPT/TIG domain/Photosynthesis system II assembly factor YCF48
MLRSATRTDQPATMRRAYRRLGLTLILLTLALALPAGASGFISAGNDHWFKQTSGSIEWLNGVDFSDAAHGWAVGDGGTILATTNGGATWGAQSSGGCATLEAVAFSDATHGWAVGEGGTILATTNGGATWGAQSSGTTEWLNGVAFSDANHGWAVGEGGTILATTNGGATWGAQSSGNTEWLFGVAFSDATHGWAVGGDGIILATTTGGFPPGPAAPRITKLKPASGKRGALVAINGANLGAAQRTGSVKFGSKACTKYVSWSTTRIVCQVPTKAKYGAVKVTVKTTAGMSNAMSFTVKR